MLYLVTFYAQPGEISFDPEMAECFVVADNQEGCLVVAKEIIDKENRESESCVAWVSSPSFRGKHDQPGISVFSISLVTQLPQRSDLPMYSRGFSVARR